MRLPSSLSAMVMTAMFGVACSSGSVQPAVDQQPANPTSSVTPAAPRADAPDFGPRVHVFDPTMSMGAIQVVLDRIFEAQETAQMGDERHALLFLPGEYQLDVNVAYYMEVQGLGRSPEDVVIRGHVHSEADWFDGNSTHNFWRSVANMTTVPDGGLQRWAVSQAAPFRRMHVRGDLVLDDGGWSSGGFIANSVIEGSVNAGGQQQWFTRDTNLGSWSGGVWNVFFMGVDNPPAGEWPTAPITVIDRTPRIRDKPFLFVDESGDYVVFVPDGREGTQGPTWLDGPEPGRSISIEEFYLARPDDDDAASINAALRSGRHLLLTPGIYPLTDSLRVTRPGTVVLGLGLPTLRPTQGTPVLEVDDVGGVRIAGLTFDAGPEDAATLMRVGGPGSEADHSANPTSLHDIFCRIGGAYPGQATSCLTINSHDVIGDHFWLWRADHGEGVGWELNRSRNGLVVNGDDVRIYGLFVEHFQEYQTLWRGERGRVFFYQSEMPYFVPNQAVWQHDGVDGWASYKVADEVTDHEAWGLGVYSVFHAAPVTCDRAIEVPVRDTVRLTHMVVTSIGSQEGRVEHVVNDVGGPATNADPRQTVDAYP